MTKRETEFEKEAEKFLIIFLFFVTLCLRGFSKFYSAAILDGEIKMNLKKAVSQSYKNLWPLPATTVLISCIGKTSIPNIITIGACGIASASPPLISLAIGTRQYSLDKHGRWFKRYLSPDMWAELENTFSGADIEENWEAFFRTIDLFRKLAKSVAAELKYEYPDNLDLKMSEYYLKVKVLEK